MALRLQESGTESREAQEAVHKGYQLQGSPRHIYSGRPPSRPILLLAAASGHRVPPLPPDRLLVGVMNGN
ncbi:hypothetical protein E2C01_036768 [Portunus trituberculatus]|uniref:Uncharacterized protein n=1 Tax=Portunus trituberculatus TaxID=210409 RepID=A0A5B7F7K8_PORTR|nr:hypothetical protein [Portunus trituberculatus]